MRTSTGSAHHGRIREFTFFLRSGRCWKVLKGVGRSRMGSTKVLDGSVGF